MEDAGMRAMQIIEWGKPLEAREYPDPEPKGEEVLLRVEAAGVCHSDVHIWDGALRFGRRPRTRPSSRVLNHGKPNQIRDWRGRGCGGHRVPSMDLALDAACAQHPRFSD